MKFEKKIRMRFGVSVAYLIIGLGLVLLGAFHLFENDTMISIGLMLFVGGAYRFRQYFRLLKNPDQLHQEEIRETDERNVQLSVRSGNLTFRLGILMLGISMAVAYFAGQLQVVGTLSSVLCCMLVVYYISYFVFSRKS